MWLGGSIFKALTDEKISIKRKERIIKRNGFKLELEIRKLSNKEKLNYLFDSDLLPSVKQKICKEINDMKLRAFSIEPDTRFMEIAKLFEELYSTREELLYSSYCHDDFKIIIINKIYGKSLVELINDNDISFEVKRVIIDLSTSDKEMVDLLETDLPNDIKNYIVDKKIISTFPIVYCINSNNISNDIIEKIISKKINESNIFEISFCLTDRKREELLRAKSDVLEKIYTKVNNDNLLSYLTNHLCPSEFTQMLVDRRFNDVLSAIKNVNIEKLTDLLVFNKNDKVDELIFSNRGNDVSRALRNTGSRELVHLLISKKLPLEEKVKIISEQSEKILHYIKESGFDYVKLVWFSERNNYPAELQELAISVFKEELINDFLKKDYNELKSSIHSATYIKFILENCIDDKKTLKLLERISPDNRLVDIIFEVKKEVLSNYVKSLNIINLIRLNKLDAFPIIKDRILLEKQDYVKEVINHLSDKKKYVLLNAFDATNAGKMLLLESFGIDRKKVGDYLVLTKNNPAEVVVENLEKVKEIVEKCGISFKSLIQYGGTSEKYTGWLLNLVKIINDNKSDEFINCKNYLFVNYYEKLLEKENAVYMINSFLEIIENYTKYRELINGLASNNINLSEKDKMDLKFLFNLSVSSDLSLPKTLDELSSFKHNLYKGYIDKINNDVLCDKSIRKVFNDLLFCGASEMLANIGGSGALRTLKNDNNKCIEIQPLIDELMLYARVIEMVNDTNNSEGLRKVLKKVFSDIDSVTKFQSLFSSFEDKVTKLYELDSKYNLTTLDEARKIGCVDRELSDKYGGEVFNFSDKNYVLYAHVVSDYESMDKLVKGISSGDRNFISLSAISYRGQTYYYRREKFILAYDRIPNGSFIRSSLSNMATNGQIVSNSAEVSTKADFSQRGILESSSAVINNPEALLYREGLIPCGLILPGGRVPTNDEIEAHKKYNLPFIVTQEISTPIEDVNYVFKGNEFTDNIELINSYELKEIIKTLKSDTVIKKEDSNYTGREIAIITDCHSMYEPTLEVLEDIRRHGITEIYSLGDNVGLGPNPCEVFDLLEEYGVISVAGNSEYYNTLGTDPFTYFYEEKQKSQDWTANKLGIERINKIKLYPASIDLVLGGEKLALCHFINDVRWDYNEHSTHVYQANYGKRDAASQFLYTNSLKCKTEINRAIKTSASNDKRSLGYISAKESPLFNGDTIKKYDSIIQGHVHFDREDEIEGVKIHTLRAVGMGYEKDEHDTACYYVLKEKKDGSFDKEKRLVKFNKNNLLSNIYTSNLPNKAAILRYVKS